MTYPYRIKSEVMHPESDGINLDAIAQVGKTVKNFTFESCSTSDPFVSGEQRGGTNQILVVEISSDNFSTLQEAISVAYKQ
jgi:hypothetical protein